MYGTCQQQIQQLGGTLVASFFIFEIFRETFESTLTRIRKKQQDCVRCENCKLPHYGVRRVVYSCHLDRVALKILKKVYLSFPLK